MSYSDRAAKAYKDAEFHVVKGGGHGFQGKTFEQAMGFIDGYLEKKQGYFQPTQQTASVSVVTPPSAPGENGRQGEGCMRVRWGWPPYGSPGGSRLLTYSLFPERTSS